MGVYKFVRSGSAVSKAALPSGRKGESLTPTKEIRFDSSPKYSICKYFGWDPDKFDLRNGHEVKEGHWRYDVWAGNFDSSKTHSKPFKVGVLEYTEPRMLEGAWRG